jgi:hypothetical protein
MTSLFFRMSNQKLLRTIVIIAIAVVCSIGIIAAVFVVGGIYQQELFDDYMEDVQDSQSSRPFINPNLPTFDILP